MENSIKNNFIRNEIKNLYFSDLQINLNVGPEVIKITSAGKYSINNLDFLKFNIDNKIENNKLNLFLNFDYGEKLQIDMINYKKTNETIANFTLDFEKNFNQIKVKKLEF